MSREPQEKGAAGEGGSARQESAGTQEDRSQRITSKLSDFEKFLSKKELTQLVNMRVVSFNYQ